LRKLLGAGFINEDAIVEGLEGKLSNKVIEGYKLRKALRNKLVHAYSFTSYDKDVYEQASNTGDIELFVKEVSRLIK
jgi:uncharacterized protein YutE (UPF0331/DUF86 family)